MALGITAALAGAGYPRSVQVAATGLTAAQVFTVSALAADGTAWTVRGGNGGLAADTTVVLGDAFAPLNMDIVYTVTQLGSSASSTAIEVPYTGKTVLQSLDGRTTVSFIGVGDSSQRGVRTRAALYDIPGRTSPVVRWDVSAGETGAFGLLMTKAESDAFRAYLRTVGPVAMLRTDGSFYDLPASQYIVITSADSEIAGATDRVWSPAYVVIGDPEPSSFLAVSAWADFDAAYAALTWADFDAEWASLTWDQFDIADWVTH